MPLPDSVAKRLPLKIKCDTNRRIQTRCKGSYDLRRRDFGDGAIGFRIGDEQIVVSIEGKSKWASIHVDEIGRDGTVGSNCFQI